jgi:hypothetical protein
MRGHPLGEVGDRIGHRARAMPPLGGGPVLDHAIAQPPGRARLGAQERVARPGLASCRRRLEKKREAATPQLGERRDGGVDVEKHIAPYRYELAA